MEFVLCVIDIHSISAWVITLKDKKAMTLTNDFQKNLDESKQKPKKILIDKGSEFFRSMKLWLEKIAEGFIRILKKEIYK